MVSLASCKFGTVGKILKRLFLGQALAFLISLTGVSTTKLLNSNASYPVLQSVTAYAFIAAFYLPSFTFILYKYRGQRFSDFKFLKRWWKYAILAVIDLEANYVVVLAYQFTNMMSVQLLSCFTVPSVMVLSFVVLRMKFAVTHVLGGAIAIGGLVFLIVLDAHGQSHSKGGGQEVLGDMLCLVSSFLYATSNVLTEWYVKPSKPPLIFHCCRRNQGTGESGEVTSGLTQTDIQEPASTFSEEGESNSSQELLNVPAFIPVVENLAMMSSFALVFATIQFFAVEWKTFQPNRSSWTGQEWLFQMLFGVTMLLVYTAMPLIFIISSAAFANISLLTVNVYGIIWNVTVFKISPTKLFFVSYFIIVVGILVYNLTDIVRIPFCTRWNYPCGDPFKQRGSEMETDAEEQLQETPESHPQNEAGSPSNEPGSVKKEDAIAKVAVDGNCQLHEPQLER
ncbi:hypothetical protein LSCM1_04383 [Leishmania martiniquensis]|uniref:Uncharacterized protein n=1 Tax=Leishmania martiniquensis TaxID=1580590 RepID=A0A836KPU8_9TRYP|nr:hypothetical protein LSCM1_04383 [Leishmania martiniquensis]